MSQMGQTQKYSKRAKIFQTSSPTVWLGLVQAEGVFYFISNMASALPASEQADKVFDLLAGWQLDSFLLIRYRPRYPGCV
jgi:hypothetical protein